LLSVSTRNQVVLVILAVLLVRLPFLNQAIQGDDIYYLAGAQHAQLDPLHPSHAQYVFLGKVVDMRGHPHPPLNAWYLGLLLALFKDIREVPFHAAYILFSLIAALSMLWLARRFTDQPIIATLLFIGVPPFLVNGNSLESDMPFLAFWMLTMAAYIHGRTGMAICAAVLASLSAYQAIFLIPILYFAPRPDGRRSWSVIATPALTIGAFQIFERLTSGALPAAVLSGYITSYGWQQFATKIRNAVALSGHLVFTLVCPVAWLARRPGVNDSRFLWIWLGLFFAGSLVIFFAGSARYLLPLAAPLCLLVSTSRFATPAIAIQGTLGLAMAVVNYQHWGGIRQFAKDLSTQGSRRVFVQGEWGLRYYVESRGGIPLQIGQQFRPGDMIVSTAYVGELPPGNRTLVQQAEIDSPIPVRIVGLGSQSGYSSIQFGLLPFGLSTVPLDRLRAEVVTDFTPTLQYIAIGASDEANRHIASGVSPSDRWALQTATLSLKRSATASRLRVKFYVPANGLNRSLTITVDGIPVIETPLDHEGIYELETVAGPPTSGKSSLTISTDKPLQTPGDQRLLGVNLLEIGFVAPHTPTFR
jgi:hypothetical protein